MLFQHIYTKQSSTINLQSKTQDPRQDEHFFQVCFNHNNFLTSNIYPSLENNNLVNNFIFGNQKCKDNRMTRLTFNFLLLFSGECYFYDLTLRLPKSKTKWGYKKQIAKTNKMDLNGPIQHFLGIVLSYRSKALLSLNNSLNSFSSELIKDCDNLLISN